MRTLLPLALATLLLAGCDATEPDLEPGTARVRVETASSTVSYEARALFDTIVIAEQPYERIRLLLDGDGTLDLVCPAFTRGTHRHHYPGASDFFASLYQAGDRRSLHASEDGTLHIYQAAGGEVIGDFELALRDAASSCILCPDSTRLHASGTFHAVAP